MADVRLDEAKIRELMESQPVAQTIAERAVRVQRVAKELCPVDTGRLRSSITVRYGRDGEGLYAEVGSLVEYAAYVEFGTSRSKAKPYLRPALGAAKGAKG